jgi:UDP-arabinose 4-epimerase
MNVLVTGGAGYIGSHTCKQLAASGHTPVVLDNLLQGHLHAVRWGPFVRGDIGDRDLLCRTIRNYRIEGVVHFAAHAYVGESLRDPRKYFHNNVGSTLVLLDAIMEGGLNKVVFSSSCATYGIPQQLPIPEHHRQLPINPYGASKLMIENVLQWYRPAYGLESMVLRYFNAAGADPDGEIGEAHDPETHLIPLVIAAGQGRIPAIEIFGTDYDTADGTAIRDYVHVSDLADAHVRAIAHLEQGGPGEVINLGTGTGHSIRDVIHAVQRIGGTSIPCREAPRRAGDPPVLIADPTRAANLLAWHARLSDLDTIVATAWRWHKDNVQ